MALYPAPMTAILGAIAAQNKGVTLDPSLYTFGAPTPYSDPLGQTNTSMLITVAEVTSPYQGSQTVYYKRLNLADLATLLPQPIQGNGWATVADFWALLNTNFGLNFVAGDLNDSTALVIAGDGSGTVTLVAQSGSLGWVGQVTLSFALGNYNLATLVNATTLPGLLYPNPDTTKPYGELYSYWRDMTAWQADLQGYTTSTNDLTKLTADLAACTGDAWTNTAAGRFSTMGATVVYNGTTAAFTPITGTMCTPNPGYQYVIVVKLNATNSLGYSGFLFLHYGLIDIFANTDATAVKTAMLLHFDGINGSTLMVDNAKPSRTFTVTAPAALSITESMWGGSSLYVPGSGNVSTPDAAELKLTGDFSIEVEIFPTNVSTSQIITCKGAGGRLIVSGGSIFAYDDTGGNQMQGGAVLANQWNAIALVKKGSTTMLFVNGTLVATNTAFTTYGNNAGAMFIGCFSDLSAPFTGWIEELRISNVARYNATYTTSTAQFYVD